MSKSSRVKSELLSLLSSSRDGRLHASDVVSWARRNPRSALHSQFVWSDKKAAHEYRLWQARRLILVNVVDESDEPTLVNLTIDRGEGGGYRKISDVLSSKKLSQIMLDDALDELERVRVRYGRVKQLTSVWKLVAKLRRSRVKK